jgi:hypothetical protein
MPVNLYVHHISAYLASQGKNSADQLQITDRTGSWSLAPYRRLSGL